jgi:S1-C subfamily serine protease
MTVVFEATESGTRITITQSGFGDGVDAIADMSAAVRGLEETIADLILYLETGVAFPRHHRGEKSFHGIAAREARAGVEVIAAQPGTFAGRLGLQRGDVLVELGGAGVFGLAELGFFTKEHAVGEVASAAWIRNRQLLRGSAELGPRLPVAAAS